MLNETDAWNSFLQSGSVLDYLQYKAIQNAREGRAHEDEEDEILDERIDHPTAEYR